MLEKTLKKNGNSYYVCIDRSFLRQLGIIPGTGKEIEIEMRGKEIIIKKREEN